MSTLQRALQVYQNWSETWGFFYLNIISSGPANCLKWKILSWKAKLQQICLFERQWHFKIDVLKLPHAFWEEKEIQYWYFTDTSQKHRHEVPWLTSLSFAWFGFACPFHVATFWPSWNNFVRLCFFLWISESCLGQHFCPNPGFQLMFQQNLGSFSPQ